MAARIKASSAPLELSSSCPEEACRVASIKPWIASVFLHQLVLSLDSDLPNKSLMSTSLSESDESCALVFAVLASESCAPRLAIVLAFSVPLPVGVAIALVQGFLDTELSSCPCRTLPLKAVYMGAFAGGAVVSFLTLLSADTEWTALAEENCLFLGLRSFRKVARLWVRSWAGEAKILAEPWEVMLGPGLGPEMFLPSAMGVIVLDDRNEVWEGRGNGLELGCPGASRYGS
jgi:hypothetical protein